MTYKFDQNLNQKYETEINGRQKSMMKQKMPQTHPFYLSKFIREKKIQMNRVYDIDLKLREKSKDQYDLLSKMPRLVPIL